MSFSSLQHLICLTPHRTDSPSAMGIGAFWAKSGFSFHSFGAKSASSSRNPLGGWSVPSSDKMISHSPKTHL